MSNDFKFDPEANVCGTSFHDTEVSVSYDKIVELFGPPLESDGYKVSSEWDFSSGSDVVTLYDWKETELYDPSYPSVAEFRALPSANWHVGAKNREVSERFKIWLLKQISPSGTDQ